MSQGHVPCAIGVQAGAQMCAQAISRKKPGTWSRRKGKGRGGVRWLFCLWEVSNAALRCMLNWKPDP